MCLTTLQLPMRPKWPRATTRGYSKMVIHAATDRLWEVSELAVLRGSLGARVRKSGVRR